MVAITFKLSAAEARALRAQARAAHKTVSAHLRSVVFPPKPERPRRRLIKKHPVSGVRYDATAKGARTVTLDEVKAALVDFP